MSIPLLMKICYLILYIAPFSFLRYYIFRKKLRLSYTKLTILYCVLLFVQVDGYVLLFDPGMKHYGNLLQVYRVFWVLLFFSLSCIVIKEKFSKQFFVYLIILCVSSLCSTLGYFMEYTIFKELSDTYPNLITNVVMVILSVLCIGIYIKSIASRFEPFLQQEDSKIWKVIFMIPLFFYFENYIFTLKEKEIGSWEFLVSRIIMMLGVLITVGILIFILNESIKNTMLKEKIRTDSIQIRLQHQQYEAMVNRIHETRKEHHDLRHYAVLIRDYLETDNKEQLKEYLKKFEEKYLDTVPFLYCENHIANVMFVHYSNLCKEKGIRMDIKGELKQECKIEEKDLLVVLGNLLENAMQACERNFGGESLIKVRFGGIGKKFAFMIENTYDGKLEIDKDGSFFSSKRKGEKGIGISSVRTIASSYQGSCFIEHNLDVFKVKVLLMPYN